MQSHLFSFETHHLDVRFQETAALKDISLKVPTGAVLGLVGRNGSGKSTLLRCLMGITAPSNGHCELLGQDPLELQNNVRQTLGYVPQVADHLEWLSVRDQLKVIGGFYDRWSAAYAEQLCAKLDLSGDAKIRTLSVGDQQKLALVLALAHSPSLLILDEPVASLDPMSRREFIRSLFESVDSCNPHNQALLDRTIILSSHLLSDLERIATHIAFLKDGRLQLMDSLDDICEHYRVVDSSVALVEQAGLINQRRASENWKAVIDTRIFSDASNISGAGIALSLDEMFMELNA
jgi:ABC-2 type transport system ATP-binding protein